MRGPRTGLSLLEVVIALSILAVATIVMTIVFAASFRLSGQSDRIATANRDLQQALESIMATPFNDITGGVPAPPPPRWPASQYPGGAPNTLVIGEVRGLDLDGDGALIEANDVLFSLPQQDIWIEWQPIDDTGPIGNLGDVGNPLQIKIVIRWNEPDGTQLVRSAVTVVAN